MIRAATLLAAALTAAAEGDMDDREGPRNAARGALPETADGCR